MQADAEVDSAPSDVTTRSFIIIHQVQVQEKGNHHLHRKTCNAGVDDGVPEESFFGSDSEVQIFLFSSLTHLLELLKFLTVGSLGARQYSLVVRLFIEFLAASRLLQKKLEKLHLHCSGS